jgi:hypothetical protein
MDMEADIDAKMDKIGRLGGHPSSRRGNNFSHKGYHHPSGGASYHPKRNWNWGKPQQQQKRGKKQNGSFSMANSSKYVTLPFSIQNLCSCVGGRLSLFFVQWQSLMDDPWILNVVKFGYFIDFLRLPVQDNWPSEIIMDVKKSKICVVEVRTLLRKSAFVLALMRQGL